MKCRGVARTGTTCLAEVELVEGAVETAIEGGFVADEEMGGVVIGDGVAGEVEFVADSEALADLAGLVADGAVASPIADGDFLDEEFLDHADGPEFIAQLGEEGFELVGVFEVVAGGYDEVSGEEAVFEGVEAGDGFAVGGAGAGGIAGVSTIGPTLGGGGSTRHGSPRGF